MSLTQIGNTPLHVALKQQHVEVIEILASKADLNCHGDVSNKYCIDLYHTEVFVNLPNVSIH